MRKSNALILLPALLLALSSPAQTTWWGMTAAGGTYGTGAIYNVTEAGAYTKAYDFFRYEGAAPKGDLVKVGSLYYGVTEFGGANGVGVLFSYNPGTSAYTILQNFTTSTSGAGARPIRGPILAANGRLYGMCSQGGANNLGTLYEYVIGTNTLTKRVDFDALTSASGKGNTPRGRLVQAASGLMYGVTQLGGANNRGVIFRVSATGTSFTKLYDFAALPSITGGQPFSGMTLGSNGVLYGTTQLGGTNGGGVIYSYNISTSTYASVYDFVQASGRFPLGELTQASNGLFYGTTTQGGTNDVGVVFTYDATTDTYTNRQNLSSAVGSNPIGRMIIGSDGLLYGTTSQGGVGSAGTIYSINPTTNVFNVVYNLGLGAFSEPWGALLEDPSGTLVGMSAGGGTGSQGAIFKYVIGGSTTELVPFTFSNGSAPKGRLLKASNGLFYGLTNTGGVNNLGILFSYDPTNGTFTRLFSLNSTSGSFPLGKLAEVNGKLYGVCSAGTATGGGSIFEYDIAGNTFTKKYELGLASVGITPLNGFFNDLSGKLYSTTSVGGANGAGTLFQYVPSTNTLTKLRDFSSSDGGTPLGDLMKASNGIIYGTCSTNGQFGFGSIFSWNPSTNTFTGLYSFNSLEGATPAGDLVQAANGKLYGTFKEDGQGNTGGIYSWNITSSTYTEEYDFNIAPITTEGQFPEANLIAGVDGLLYGTCTQGGANGLGNVFRFNPTSLAITSLTDMDGTLKGSTPYDGLTTDVVPTNPAVTLSIKLFLEGPFNSGTGKMNTALRLLTGANGFPTTEPFTAAGFTLVNSGGETINSSVLSTTGDNAVVDWVLVELRDKNNSSTILRTKPALLQSDGDIVDLDNTSTISLNVPADNYFVAVRHRNHLGVMTSGSVPLSSSSALIDFTSPATGTFGTNATKTIGAMKACWAGNVVRNTNIRYTGASNDRDPILVRVGSSLPTNTVSGYYAEDVTLNGIVQYTGAGNDRDPILVNVGGTTPNNQITEQIP